jgi:hypothetical protein
VQEIILDPKLVARQSTLKGVTQLKAVD